MSKKKARPVKLHLTERAVQDLIDIEAYSVKEWGKRVATKYLADIDQRLQLIKENPGVLAAAEGFPAFFQYYPTGSHVLIFDVRPRSLVLLTVIHGSRDIPKRLAEFAPAMALEVEILHSKLAD